MIDLVPGSKFGSDYEIIRPINTGGYGAVYLVRSVKNPHEQYALKVLFIGQVQGDEIKARFKNELIVTTRLAHPNIIRAYDYYEDSEIQAYVMEYVPNGDLSERLTGQPIKPRQVIEVMKQVAAGLQAVHSHGVVHRDLKPENILITADGVVKLSDFGLARLRGGVTLTQSGSMVGTAKYLSPEYAETGECDHRADIYALGVIGYEMVSGISPVGSDLKLAVILENIKKPVASLATVAPHCPPQLAAIIERAMHFELDKRYQTAAELEADLGGVAQLMDFAGQDSKQAESVEQTENFKSMGLTQPKIKPRQRNFRLITAAAVAVGAALLVMLKATLDYSNSKQISISSLPRGMYEGKIEGLFDDVDSRSLYVWKSEFGTYFLIGKEGCEISPLTTQERFSCGPFELQILKFRERDGTITGEVQEVGWGIKGKLELQRR